MSLKVLGQKGTLKTTFGGGQYWTLTELLTDETSHLLRVVRRQEYLSRWARTRSRALGSTSG